VEHLIDMMSYSNWDYLRLLTYILALGAFVMALLQLINDLTPVRAIYQTTMLRKWIDLRIKLFHRTTSGGPHPVTTKDALRQLIDQATGGHSRALLSLPPSQLVAQINAAAQGALDNVPANFALLAVLGQPTQAQIPFLLQRTSASPSQITHFGDLMTLATPPEPPTADIPSATRQFDEETKRYVEARTRVVHRIQRNLDGMQITLGNSSALANQIIAILIGIALTYTIIIYTRISPDRSYALTVLLLGVLTGYVAPILGDVVTAIRRFGQR